MFCSTEMSPVERWGSGEGFVILRNVPGTDLVLLWGNTFTDPPHAHSGLTGEPVAVVQDQILERHVLEGRDVTWWDERGALREDREEGSAVDQIQVLP